MIIQLRHAEPLCKPFAHSLLNFLLGKRDGTSPQLCFPTAASTDRVQCKWNQCPFQLLCLRENRVIVHNPKLSVLIRFVTNGLLPRSDRMYRLLVEPVHQTPPPPLQLETTSEQLPNGATIQYSINSKPLSSMSATGTKTFCDYLRTLVQHFGCTFKCHVWHFCPKNHICKDIKCWPDSMNGLTRTEGRLSSSQHKSNAELGNPQGIFSYEHAEYLHGAQSLSAWQPWVNQVLLSHKGWFYPKVASMTDITDPNCSIPISAFLRGI